MKRLLQKKVKKKKFCNKKSKKIFYNNLGICSVMIYFTVCLCITKEESFLLFA